MLRGEEALGIAAEKAYAFTSIHGLSTLSDLYVRKGDVDRAVNLLDEATRITRESGIIFFNSRIAALLGHIHTLGGRHDAASACLEQAVEHSVGGLGLRDHSLSLAWLGEAYLLAGKRDQAINYAASALSVARQRAERGREAYALRLLAEIAAHADPPEVEEAESHYRQALALAEELRMRPLQAHCHLGLGTLHQKIGRQEQAQAELATAAEMYRSMEMTFWLAKAEAALS
jgi:tetratricopeptide (TPR) repeat protein